MTLRYVTVRRTKRGMHKLKPVNKDQLNRIIKIPQASGNTVKEFVKTAMVHPMRSVMNVLMDAV